MHEFMNFSSWDEVNVILPAKSSPHNNTVNSFRHRAQIYFLLWKVYTVFSAVNPWVSLTESHLTLLPFHIFNFTFIFVFFHFLVKPPSRVLKRRNRKTVVL